MEIKRDFIITGADTDSISFCKKDEKSFSKEEQENLIIEINDLLPDLIKYENDGYFKSFMVAKAKNYAMIEHGKNKSLTIKGSGLKVTNKEIALKELIENTINLLLAKKNDRIFEIYNKYCSEVVRDTIDISRWTSRKSITKAVLNPERTNEQKVYDIIKDMDVQEGDKIRVYFELEKNLKLEADYANDHNVDKLLKKIHSNMKVFENIIDIPMLPDYSLKRNKDLRDEL